MQNKPARHRFTPEERAEELNKECVRLIQLHEKPAVIHAVRAAYRRALTEAERYNGIIRVSVPQAAIPPHMTYVEDEICRWNNLPLK